MHGSAAVGLAGSQGHCDLVTADWQLVDLRLLGANLEFI